jgi:sterol 14-demethylase
MRVAQQQQQVGDVELAPGQMVAVSVSVSNRDPDAFEEADLYDPGRYLGERNDEVNNPWMWIPFGAGRHRCVGAAFALMQLKAIFLTLLKDWEFEAAQPLDSYRDDLSKMVIQLQQPCAVRFRRRGAPGGNEGEFGVGADSSSGPVGDVSERYRVVVDDVLCQGHGVCESEAPAVFAVDTSTHQVRIVNERPGETERSRVETAVRYCPTRALKIQSED